MMREIPLSSCSAMCTADTDFIFQYCHFEVKNEINSTFGELATLGTLAKSFSPNFHTFKKNWYLHRIEIPRGKTYF